VRISVIRLKMNLHVGMKFDDFESAKTCVIDFCKTEYHPIRCDKKESVGKYNARVSDDCKITALQSDAVHSYR